MDDFDTKIYKMRKEIDSITKEIDFIQKKNSLSKKKLQNSIRSLSNNSKKSMTNINNNETFKLNDNNNSKIISNYNDINNKYSNLNKINNNNINNISNIIKKNNPIKININLNKVKINDNYSDKLKEMMDNIGYNGKKENFKNYIKIIKSKSEITKLINKKFNNKTKTREIKNCYKISINYINNYKNKENEFIKEINMYQNLVDELLKKHQNKLNALELNKYFNEINKIKTSLEKYINN